MCDATINKFLLKGKGKKRSQNRVIDNLSQVACNVAYKIKAIDTQDKQMADFLFTLGCYEGEHVTVISILADNYVIAVKDARYSIDTELAEVIKVELLSI